MEPEDLFETISQSLLNSVDRDALSGWGAHVYVITKDKVIKRLLKGSYISFPGLLRVVRVWLTCDVGVCRKTGLEWECFCFGVGARCVYSTCINHHIASPRFFLWLERIDFWLQSWLCSSELVICSWDFVSGVS